MVFKVTTSPKYNQVIIGNVIIDVANPINLTDHRFPNPIYPHLVANQNKAVIGIPINKETVIPFQDFQKSQTNCPFS